MAESQQDLQIQKARLEERISTVDEQSKPTFAEKAIVVGTIVATVGSAITSVLTSTATLLGVLSLTLTAACLISMCLDIWVRLERKARNEEIKRNSKNELEIVNQSLAQLEAGNTPPLIGPPK